jgi:hypothetical protein
LSLWIACCLFARSLCLTGVPFRLVSDYEKKGIYINFYIVAKILERIYPDIDIYIYLYFYSIDI